MKPCRVRFAPSPTGYLHVGNIRTALINYLFCRKNGGTFLLRIDDTDTERSQEVYEKAIYADMSWLGLSYDETARQSTRFDRYDAAVEQLKKAGRLYACYETQEELAFKRKMQLSKGLPPKYDRAGLHLTDQEREAFEAQGRTPHWRFKILDEAVEWEDLVRGPVHFEGAHLSDPVLIREDGKPIYTLASVVDDCELDVTHIIRGEDHVANTAIQVQLIKALGYKQEDFHFAHLPLIADEKGGGISKRLGSTGVSDLKNEGLLPMALNAVLARIGTSTPVEPFQTLQPLIESFSFDAFARSTPKFSEEELKTVNAKLIHESRYEDIRSYISEWPQVNETLWETLKKNLTSFSDLTLWCTILEGNFTTELSAEDKAFLKEASSYLPTSGWDEDPWQVWQTCLKEKTGRRGKELLKPIRLALTGLDKGPELGKLVKLLGRDEIIKRLER